MPDVYPNIIELYNKKVKKILTESNVDQNKYLNFLRDLENLNKKIAPYFAKREESGKFPPILGKDFNEIKESYNLLLSECNNLSQDGDIVGAARSQINEIKQSLFGDYQAMLDYGDQKDDAKINLFAVINDYKAKQISVNTNDLQTVGNALSSRIPVSITDEVGKTSKGFFTKEKKLDSAEGFFIWLDNVERTNPQLASRVKNIYNEYKETKKKENNNEQLTPAAEKKITWQFIDDLVEIPYKDFLNFASNYGNTGAYKSLARFNAMAVKLGLSESHEEYINTFNVPQKTLDAGESFRSLTNTHSLYHNALKCKDGDNVDKNNIAMTDVATLLGANDLICKSKPMKMKINGQEVDGTFMEEASGVHITHMPKEHPLYGKKLNSISIGKGLQKMADLQAIDYICGNIDRHPGNMLYQFDEKGNFIGVQGIDNDCSFGESNLKEGLKELPGLDKMKYISRDMADRLNICNDQVLRMSLGTRGLRQGQIDACCARLNQVKEAIMRGKISVKTDEEFEQLGKNLVDPRMKPYYIDDISDECYVKKGLNMVERISNTKAVSKQENELKFNEGKEAQPEGLDSKYLVNMSDKQSELFDNLKQGVNELAETPEFKKLQAAVKSLTGLKTIYENDTKLSNTAQVRYESVLKRISKAADKFIEVNPELSNNLSDCVRNMKKKCTNDLSALKKSLNEQQNSMERHTDYLADVLGEERKHYEKLDSFAKIIDGKKPKYAAVGNMIKELNKYVLANPKASPSNCYAKTIVAKSLKYLGTRGVKNSGLTKADIMDAEEVITRGRSVETVKKNKQIETENKLITQSMGAAKVV